MLVISMVFVILLEIVDDFDLKLLFMDGADDIA
jgi:hypothetical protein